MAGHLRSLGSQHNGKPAVVSRWSQTGTSVKEITLVENGSCEGRGEARRLEICVQVGNTELWRRHWGPRASLWSCCCAFRVRTPSPRRLTTPPCRMCSSSPNFRQPSKSQAGLVPVLLCQGKPGSHGRCVLRVCSPPLSRPLPTLSWHTEALSAAPVNAVPTLATTLVYTDTSNHQGEEGGFLSGWVTSGKSPHASGSSFVTGRETPSSGSHKDHMNYHISVSWCY